MANSTRFALDELECARPHLPEVLRILLHAVLYQRALGEPNHLDAASETFDLSYIKVDNPTLDQIVEKHAEAIARSIPADTRQLTAAAATAAAATSAATPKDGSSSSSPTPDVARLRLTVSVAFFERRQKAGGPFGFFRSEERVVWERWAIPLAVVLPERERNVHSSVANAAEATRTRRVEANLRERLEYILTTASERRDHIPPVDSLGGSVPWFEISSDSTESSGVLDLFKQMLLSSPPSLLPAGSGSGM